MGVVQPYLRGAAGSRKNAERRGFKGGNNFLQIRPSKGTLLLNPETRGFNGRSGNKPERTVFGLVRYKDKRTVSFSLTGMVLSRKPDPGGP